MSSLREELQRKQQRWMAERQLSLDRHEAEVSLGGTKADDHALLDRVTTQITQRLQAELRLQNARAMQDGAVGDRVERADGVVHRHFDSPDDTGAAAAARYEPSTRHSQAACHRAPLDGPPGCPVCLQVCPGRDGG